VAPGAHARRRRGPGVSAVSALVARGTAAGDDVARTLAKLSRKLRGELLQLPACWQLKPGDVVYATMDWKSVKRGDFGKVKKLVRRIPPAKDSAETIYPVLVEFPTLLMTASVAQVVLPAPVFGDFCRGDAVELARRVARHDQPAGARGALVCTLADYARPPGAAPDAFDDDDDDGRRREDATYIMVAMADGSGTFAFRAGDEVRHAPLISGLEHCKSDTVRALVAFEGVKVGALGVVAGPNAAALLESSADRLWVDFTASGIDSASAPAFAFSTKSQLLTAPLWGALALLCKGDAVSTKCKCANVTTADGGVVKAVKRGTVGVISGKCAAEGFVVVRCGARSVHLHVETLQPQPVCPGSGSALRKGDRVRATVAYELIVVGDTGAVVKKGEGTRAVVFFERPGVACPFDVLKHLQPAADEAPGSVGIFSQKCLAQPVWDFDS